MVDSKEWTQRKIQEVSGGSYRLSMPKDFAQNLDEAEYWQTGDYVVVRPAGYNDRIESIVAPFPEKLYETDPVKDAETFYSIAANLVQGLCIAAADEIDVNFPDDLDKQRADEYEEGWYRVHKHAPNHLRWDVDEKVMEIKGGLDMVEYINDVRQYFYRYLVKPLQTPELIFYEKFDYRTTSTGLGLRSKTLEEEEASIDTRWSLAIRNLGEGLYDLQRASYPQILCGFYISKYLEMCVDLVKRLSVAVAMLEERFHPDLQRLRSDEDERSPEFEDLILEIKGELANAFLGEDSEAFDEHTLEVSKSSYHLQASDPEFIAEAEIFDQKMDSINEFRRDRFLEQVGMISDAECGEMAELSLLVGEIMTISERILRFPRSICHLGVGAKHLAEARKMA